jgi:acetate kinase
VLSMNVMTLNCGSSSVKYALFDMPAGIRLCYGIVDRVTLAGSLIKHYDKDGKEHIYNHDCPNHTTAIKLIIDFLTGNTSGVIKSLRDIAVVVHRVVHGGDKFSKPVMIDDQVIARIEEYSALAPLHNPANLAGINSIKKWSLNMLQVAVFDTAFFTTMPRHVFLYGVPYEWYEKYHVRKYGFHGISHKFVTERAYMLLSKKPEEVNIITLHIGNGVSITATKKGKAYDHSMGFTPLEGPLMGTRCGDVDPGIPLYIMRKEKLGYKQMEVILNRKSGLLGVSGKYTDRREILEARKAGDARAKLCFDMECYRLRKYIGAYAAAMGGTDAVVFTAGVGENSFSHRKKICEGLGFMGIQLDDKKNKQALGSNEEMEISTPRSRVRIFVIHTNEEQVMAEEAFALLHG